MSAMVSLFFPNRKGMGGFLSARRARPAERSPYPALGSWNAPREDAGVPCPSPGPTTTEIGDRTREDFAAGAGGPGLRLARTANGPEVILAPTVGADFADGVPADWFCEPWKDGGRVEADGEQLFLDGATTGYNALFGSERSLEFVATFAKRPHQHIGFGTNFRTVPWITFSTKFGNSLYARSNFTLPEDTRLSGSLLGAPHRFRIDWRVLDIAFWVDGRRVAHQLAPVVGYMRPLVANGSLGGDPLGVEWLRMSPYAPEGGLTSQVHDAGRAVTWEGCDADADVPEDTTLGLDVRAGDTPEPGPDWSAWAAPPARGRFAQYRARLATGDSTRTPVVRAVTLRYSASGSG
jgi:hypothetical protein